MKAWRKQSRITDNNGQIVRMGRKYKEFMRRTDMGKKYSHSVVIIDLMKRAGIETPVFDNWFESMHNKFMDVKNESNVSVSVSDAELVA